MKFLLVLSLLMANVACAAIGFYENSSSAPLLQLLNQAKTSIDIEIYEMTDPQIIKAIQNALARKVLVRVVQESAPVGTKCFIFTNDAATDTSTCAISKNLIKQVRSSGGMYVPFPVQLCGQNPHCFEHGKIALIDRQYALISTGNFNATNLCDLSANPSTCNRDYSLVDTDMNVVNTIGAIFENDLKSVPYDLSTLLAQSGVANSLTVSPVSLPLLLQLINSAKTTLAIQTQYLHEVNINNAIIAAARRGVKVYVNVASACSFGKPNPMDQKAWNTIYSAFDAAGVTTRTFTRNILVNGRQGYLHAKAIVVDGVYAWVGSVNGSTNSVMNNREFGIITPDRNVVNSVWSFISSDMNNANAETWQDSLQCKNDPAPLTSQDDGN